MGRITVRIDEVKDDAMRDLADRYGMSLTEIVGDALRIWLKRHKEELPEHLEKDTTHEDIVKRNKHQMRRLQFKQRVHDKLMSFLEDDQGNQRKFPPEPTKVEDEYIESLREAVDEEYQKYAGEYHEFLDRELQWYKTMHPDSSNQAENYSDMVDYVAYHVNQNRHDLAAEYIDHARKHEKIPEDKGREDMMQDARERAEEESWREEWTQAAKGEL